MFLITPKNKKLIYAVILLAAVSIFVVLAPNIAQIFMLPYTYAASSGTTDSEIKKLEESLSKAESDRQAAQKALSDAKSDEMKAIEQKNAIDNELRALLSLIEISENIVTQYDKKISEIEAAIVENEKLLEERHEIFAQRLVTYYEEGQVSYLDILLSSEGVLEFFTRLDAIQCMLEYDRTVMKNYQTDKENLELRKSELIQLREKSESLHDSKIIHSNELNEKMKESELLIKEIESNAELAKKIYTEALNAEAELSKKLQESIAAIKKKTNSSYVGGEYLWPLPSKYKTVSSGFGNRIHPVTGKRQFHTSIDIPAPYGTEIYAANDGTVVETSYHNADGNYILIDHGGGSATFYSHLSKFAVTSGKTVKKGDVIGYVGMTGWATGYHLNFSIYDNSTPVNPMKFFQ